MIHEAEEHAAEDAKKKEEIDARNAAETLVWTTEKMLADNKDKIKEDDTKDLEGKVASLKEAIKGGDMTKIKAEADTLSTAAQKVGAALYQQQQSAPSGATQAEEVKPEEKKE